MLALAFSLIGAAGAADDGERGERERIARERAAAQARFEEQQRVCQSRFVVTACIDRARAERREALDHLTEQERVLDEARRKHRAAQRAAEIRARVERAEAMGSSQSLRIVEPRSASARKKPAARAANAAVAASAPGAEQRAVERQGAEPPSREAAERASRERFGARQRAAQEHRIRNAERVGEQAKKKPRAAPLPDPAASAGWR
jgi:hypothetical protein